VAGELHPTPDSHIGFEVWLPLDGWNRKLAGAGNAGWAGTIPYDYTGTAAGPLIRQAKVPFGFTLSDQLKRGYATAATDTGHRLGDGGDNFVAFVVGHPERLVDFGYRAIHETTALAKAIVLQFYGRAPEHTYWVGQSTGGEQALKEAQRYPDDYDGMVLGAPVLDYTWTYTRVGDDIAAILKSGLNATHWTLVHKAVLAACDAGDGAVDGLISDPPHCAFDPGSLECPASTETTRPCLTSAQVAAVRLVYEGLRDPITGQVLSEGLAKGSELSWGQPFQATPRPPNLSYMRYLVFQDPAWDWRTFDFSRAADRDAVTQRQRVIAPILNADNPNLDAFRQRGGKMLQFQGWADPISPAISSAYYSSVVQRLSATGDPDTLLRQVQGFYRLFMVPGMAHGLGNGDGPATFDLLTALENWVERGNPPDALVATQFDNKGMPVRSRPMCSYPAFAHYRGSGDVNEAASWSCR
jgi:pimeloyl-ACP methyl ester carboxylesterase